MSSPTEVRTGKRDLVARVATLELLVADLVDLLWRLDPKTMESLATQALADVETQHNRIALPVGENQRQRLFSVLQARGHMLRPRRGRAPQTPF